MKRVTTTTSQQPIVHCVPMLSLCLYVYVGSSRNGSDLASRAATNRHRWRTAEWLGATSQTARPYTAWDHRHPTWLPVRQRTGNLTANKLQPELTLWNIFGFLSFWFTVLANHEFEVFFIFPLLGYFFVYFATCLFCFSTCISVSCGLWHALRINGFLES